MNGRQFIAGLRELEANGEWDGESLADLARRCFNCRAAEIDAEGDVWIEDPQLGHWLAADALVLLANYVADECNIETSEPLTV